MKMLFCHDHIFLKNKDNYYSPGKLTYRHFSFYRDFFPDISVAARFRENDTVPSNFGRADGPGVRIYGLPNISSPLSLLKRLSVRAEMFDLINGVDVVIVRLPSELGLLACSIASEIKKPTLVELVADPYEILTLRKGLVSAIYAPILKFRTERAVLSAKFVSYVTQKQLQMIYPTLGNNIGVSDVEIASVVQARVAIRNENCIIIGLIGDPDVRVKGVKEAIEAIQFLLERGFKVELRILGGKRSAYGYTAHTAVRYDGVLEDKAHVFSWLDDLDMYIQPSLSEGLPRALVEAMSRGLPCVASKVGGIPELLPQELMIEAGDSRKLAFILEELITSQAFYHKAANYSVDKARFYLEENLYSLRNTFYKSFIESAMSPQSKLEVK
jgi:glycosyltransferase involved in cell wall biosynthesis